MATKKHSTEDKSTNFAIFGIWNQIFSNSLKLVTVIDK